MPSATPNSTASGTRARALTRGEIAIPAIRLSMPRSRKLRFMIPSPYFVYPKARIAELSAVCRAHAQTRPSPVREPEGVRARCQLGRQRAPPRTGVGRAHGLLHQLVVRGQMTYRVGAGRVAGELERLAPAATEVDLTAVAAPARVRHPVRAPETLEQRRLRPDPGQGLLPDARAGQRQRLRGRTGQR